MRGWLAFALAGALCACAQPASTELQWAACSGVAQAQARLDACSAVIADTRQDRTRRAQALVERGVLRAASQEYVRAVGDFGRALRLDPNNARALQERGNVHQARGAAEQAAADFEAAVRVNSALASGQADASETAQDNAPAASD